MVKCAICNIDIDRSACGQILAKATIEDDSHHEQTGKTTHERLHFCEEHSVVLQIWIHTEALNNLN